MAPSSNHLCGVRIHGLKGFWMFGLGALALLLIPLHANARRQDTGFLNRALTLDGDLYRYVVYLPLEWSPKQKWPVVLFLHGSGQRGTDGLDETQIGLPAALRSHPERWPFVVVMPQLPYQHHHWTDPEMMAVAMTSLFKEVKEFHGDPQRLYLTGLSMGGYGVWEIAREYPGRFAAIAPVCGGIFWPYAPQRRHELQLPEEYAHAIGRTPVWIFHGANDLVVPPAQAQIMFEAIVANSGNVRFWEYAGYHHNAWDKAYSDPQLPQWFLSHRLSEIQAGKSYAEKRLIPLHPVPLRLNPEIYDAYAGEYTDSGVIEMTVLREGNRLLSKARGGSLNELLPETSTRFFYPSGSSTRITFEHDASGRVTGLLYRDDRHEEFWERVR